MKIITLQTAIPEEAYTRLLKMARKIKASPEHAASLVLMTGLSRMQQMEISTAIEGCTPNALTTSRTDSEDGDVSKG